MVLHVLSASKSAVVPHLMVSREVCDLHVCVAASGKPINANI